ncbi:MAG TPA: hypothetical protein VFN09_01960 [Rhodanobacteraceae bacterium]|nr:hypothetical protein [Rhodanobacteraceae bacterium]
MSSLLPLLLLGPTLLILAALYWFFPRTLRVSAARRGYDVLALLLACATALALTWHGLRAPSVAYADVLGNHAGEIWPQVLAILYAYSGFCLVLGLAAGVRQRLWRQPRKP